jgi:hypothetical protein
MSRGSEKRATVTTFQSSALAPMGNTQARKRCTELGKDFEKLFKNLLTNHQKCGII